MKPETIITSFTSASGLLLPADGSRDSERVICKAFKTPAVRVDKTIALEEIDDECSEFSVEL